MTFSEFMILARKRLHDYRDKDGAIITSAATDGIRWSSSELESVCKGAILEMLRTFRAIKLDNYVHSDIQHQRKLVRLGTSGVVEDLPEIPTSSGFVRVERITDPASGMIYYRVKQKEFSSKQWRITAADSDDTDLTEGVFMSYWDGDSNELVTTVWPLPSEEVSNCIAEVIIPLTALFNSSSTVQLPFIDIDDILLDYVELQGSLIDHDLAQVKFTREVINTKLQELKIELQKST